MAGQDIPRIFTAVAEWTACVMCVRCAGLRGTRLRFMGESTLFLILQSIFLVATRDVPIYFWVVCMAAAFAMMLAFIVRSYALPFTSSLYLCLQAFLAAEFAASLGWQVTYFVLKDTNSMVTGAGSVRILLLEGNMMLIVYALVFAVLDRIAVSSISGEFFENISRQETGALFIITVLVFIFSNLSYVFPDTPFTSGIREDVFIIRTLVDLGGLGIVYAYQGRIAQLFAEREVERLNAILRSQYEQYRNYQDGIELINIKFHDLKHQIEGMKAELDPEKREAWLARMEEELQGYRPDQETGNAILNTLITGKTPIMRNLRIQFTCVSDGKLLDFLHVTDLCTIFGNALDNAIEHTAMIRNPEKRLIHLSVSEKKGFLFIELINCFEGEQNFADGLPVTTKEDKRNHGYGVKSIRRAVEKYGGRAVWTAKENEFALKILIPMPE